MCSFVTIRFWKDVAYASLWKNRISVWETMQPIQLDRKLMSNWIPVTGHRSQVTEASDLLIVITLTMIIHHKLIFRVIETKLELHWMQIT